MYNLYRTKRKSFLLFSFLLLWFNSGFAQGTQWLLKTANRFYNNENYRAAIPFYEQIIDKNPDNPQALFKAGVCYLSFDKERASDYLYKAQRLKPNVSPEIEYWLGRVDHVNYRFEDAIKHYQLYKGSLKKKEDYQKQEVNTLIEHSRNAQKMFNQPKDYFVRNLGPTINTPYSDHSPVLSNDGKFLMFTTRSPINKKGIEAADGEYYEDIVESIRQEDNSWGAPKSISANLNSKGHDAAIQLFDQDTKLLIYRQSDNGDLYISEKIENNWTLPKKIKGPINTPDYESDAFITADGNTLYFSTTYFSEDGDKDIYMATKTAKGEWGKPKNMGKNINTSFDEDSPFLTPDGKTMYFTSRGHNTMGGYDVFVTHLDSVSHRWTKPENMGYPINSPDDDTYFRLYENGTSAYISSYRMGGYGEKDIWSIDLSKMVLVKGKVIPEAEVLFRSKPADKKPVEYSVVSNPDSGTFDLQVLSGRKYQVTLTKNNQLMETQEYDIPANNLDNLVLEKDFTLNNSGIADNKKRVESTAKINLPIIYFQNGDSLAGKETENQLRRIALYLKENPEVRVSIEGHTDNINSQTYNLKLGTRRAQKVSAILVRNGVNSNQLSITSHGKLRPRFSEVNPTENKKNRRVEFLLLNSGNGQASKINRSHLPDKN